MPRTFQEFAFLRATEHLQTTIQCLSSPGHAGWENYRAGQLRAETLNWRSPQCVSMAVGNLEMHLSPNGSTWCSTSGAKIILMRYGQKLFSQKGNPIFDVKQCWERRYIGHFKFYSLNKFLCSFTLYSCTILLILVLQFRKSKYSLIFVNMLLVGFFSQ